MLTVKFSKDRPYALKISRERSYYQAHKVSDRVNEMGLHSYVVEISDTTDDSGNWFQVLYGAIPTKDSASQLQNYLAKNYHFKELEIVNYSHYDDAKLDIDSTELPELHRIGSNMPDVPNEVFRLIKKFPDNNSLYISELSVVNSPENLNDITGVSTIYNLKLDLPRGISRKMLLQATNCFAEVTYRDNLFGDKVIIDIGELRKNVAEKIEQSDDSAIDPQKAIALEYAESVLNTGEYVTERMEEIEIQSKNLLKGLKVSISLWNNQLKTYLILVDESLQYLIFSQSTDKSEKELTEILEGIGKANGLLDYDEFYNTFYTMPDKLSDNESFTAFSLNRLEDSYAKNKAYARWAKEMMGHWQASAYFFNKTKGGWTYSIFDLLNAEDQNYIYKTLYWNEQSRNKEIINIYGTKGIHVTNKKFNWKKFKNVYTTLEINFGLGRYVCAVDNMENAIFSKEELKARAESLQLDEKKKGIKKTEASL